MSTLKIYDGLEVKKLACNLPDAVPLVGGNDYQKLKRKFNNHFLPKKNKHYARWQTATRSGKSVVSYTAWLRKKVKDSKFDDQIN